MDNQAVAIVGAGPVGLALALALHQAGVPSVLLDARARSATRSDQRVLALSHGTHQILRRLGVWPVLPSTPIRTIQVAQSQGFGHTHITAREYGVEALGYVASAGDLAAALDDAIACAGIPVLEHTRVTGHALHDDRVELQCEGGAVTRVYAALVAWAEGLVTDEDKVITSDYQQHAIISNVEPTRSHDFHAYERFTADGPLALLPFGNRFAVVFTCSPRQADEILALDDQAFMDRLAAHFRGPLKLRSVTPRLRYPLGLRVRPRPIGARTVWLGNAAQTLHPVAGQGFNLALRDVWELASQIGRATTDPGAPALLERYLKRRQLDRLGTIGFTHGLVRLFSNDNPLLGMGRGFGLLALEAIPPLRNFVARRMMFGARAWP